MKRYIKNQFLLFNLIFILCLSSVLHAQLIPVIVQQPVNDYICKGENASFTVIANGGLISYQWYWGKISRQKMVVHCQPL